MYYKHCLLYEKKKDSIPNICLAYKIVLTILTIIAFA